MNKYSVLMSVYCKENKDYLDLSIKSLLNQSYQPDEIIIVKDGILTSDLNCLLNEYKKSHPYLIKLIQLDENKGLGKALNYGLSECKNELVGRMDSDDVCLKSRFEEQVRFMMRNPEISVIGSSIEEFKNNPNDLKRIKSQPCEPYKLKIYARLRNPLNHPSVVFRKSHVLAAGSYQDMPLFEDYYLWVRMINKGYKLANLKEPLLHFRIGNDMIGRRHGMSYLKKEFTFLRAIKRIGFINNKQFYLSLIAKLPLRVLPKFLLKLLYKLFLR